MIKIYIVGSALYKKNPRDIDIRMRVSDAFFKKLFKVSVKRWCEEKKRGSWGKGVYKWSDFCCKISRLLNEANIFDQIIDFQIQPSSDWKKYSSLRRLRIL